MNFDPIELMNHNIQGAQFQQHGVQSVDTSKNDEFLKLVGSVNNSIKEPPKDKVDIRCEYNSINGNIECYYKGQKIAFIESKISRDIAINEIRGIYCNIIKQSDACTIAEMLHTINNLASKYNISKDELIDIRRTIINE